MLTVMLTAVSARRLVNGNGCGVGAPSTTAKDPPYCEEAKTPAGPTG
jgi:hypothetical protein